MKCNGCGTNDAVKVRWAESEGEHCNECSDLIGETVNLEPESVKEDRKKNFKSTIQPFREGELSKEYTEAYPSQITKMVQSGSITNKDIRKSREVWRDVPGHKHWRKTQ